MLKRVRSRLTYANVIAVYCSSHRAGRKLVPPALRLPRNSVGSAQIRTHSVGLSELRTGAVRSRVLHDGSVTTRDLSPKTIQTLRGGTGPAGPPGTSAVSYRAAINSGGDNVREGNAARASHVQPGEYTIAFAQPTADCIATATLASVPGGFVATPPPRPHHRRAVGHRHPRQDLRPRRQRHGRAGLDVIVAC